MCTVESVLSSNTDDVDRVGPQGPLRRTGRSQSSFSSIGRTVQSSAAYQQLAKKTLALCAFGVQPKMRPCVCVCSQPRAERFARSYLQEVGYGGAARIQLRVSGREAVKALIPRKMETPGLAMHMGAVHVDEEDQRDTHMI